MDTTLVASALPSSFLGWCFAPEAIPGGAAADTSLLALAAAFNRRAASLNIASASGVRAVVEAVPSPPMMLVVAAGNVAAVAVAVAVAVRAPLVADQSCILLLLPGRSPAATRP